MNRGTARYSYIGDNSEPEYDEAPLLQVTTWSLSRNPELYVEVCDGCADEYSADVDRLASVQYGNHEGDCEHEGCRGVN